MRRSLEQPWALPKRGAHAIARRVRAPRVSRKIEPVCPLPQHRRGTLL